MTESKLSRRDSLRGLVAVGIAGAAATLGATALTAAPAAAAQLHMDVGRAELEAALKALKGAVADKGGFRVKAIGHTEAAIADIDAGIVWAKTH